MDIDADVGGRASMAGVWLDPAETDANVAWVRGSYDAMHRYMASGRYVNYIGDEEDGDPIAAAYGENYLRLQEIKREYDPENLFHLNQNIKPARY